MPVTARDFVFTLRARIARKAELPEDQRDRRAGADVSRAVDAKTVRVVLRSRVRGWRGLFGNILPRHALAGEDLDDDLGRRDRQPEDGQADRERPVPRRALGARRAADARPQPALLGTARAYLDRLVLRFRVAGRSRWNGSGEASSTSPGRFPPLLRPWPRCVRSPASARRPPSSVLGAPRDPVGPGGHPALENKLVRRALAYGIDRDGARPAAARRASPELSRRSTASCS